MSISTFTRSLSFVLAVGIAGGLALILALSLTTQGLVVLLPYAAIIAATVVYFVTHQINSFARRFWVGLVAFVLANVIGLIYVVTVASPAALHAPVSHHLFSLSAMLLIGIAVSAIVAFATPVRVGVN